MSSRGGLESVFDSINSAPSANGGSNPAWVWYIDRSEVATFVAIHYMTVMYTCHGKGK